MTSDITTSKERWCSLRKCPLRCDRGDDDQGMDVDYYRIKIDLTRTFEISTIEYRIKELRKYKNNYGTANIPKNCRHDIGLARWVANIRRHGKEKLSIRYRNQLNELGFRWREANLERYDDHWNEMYDRLQAYKDKHGNCLVPTESYKEDLELGLWVKNQRSNYKKNLLDDKRKQNLNDVGFVWLVRSPLKQKPTFSKLEIRWKQRFDELKEFQKVNGHTKVPKSFSKNPRLGDWVHNQRTAYARGLLRNDRQKLLNGIDFIWSPDPTRNVRQQGKR